MTDNYSASVFIGDLSPCNVIGGVWRVLQCWCTGEIAQAPNGECSPGGILTRPAISRPQTVFLHGPVTISCGREGTSFRQDSCGVMFHLYVTICKTSPQLAGAYICADTESGKEEVTATCPCVNICLTGPSDCAPSEINSPGVLGEILSRQPTLHSTCDKQASSLSRFRLFWHWWTGGGRRAGPYTT